MTTLGSFPALGWGPLFARTSLPLSLSLSLFLFLSPSPSPSPSLPLWLSTLPPLPGYRLFSRLSHTKAAHSYNANVCAVVDPLDGQVTILLLRSWKRVFASAAHVRCAMLRSLCLPLIGPRHSC